MKDLLKILKEKPALYEPSPRNMWDNPHISKQMLAAHLDEGFDSATRKMGFVKESVGWIACTLPPARYKRLLDLGCGPGIYAELFCRNGYEVTGVDISERSIRFARESARQKNLAIEYCRKDYTASGLGGSYDLITLIYCDFGVLARDTRVKLLARIYESLLPHGALLFDVFKPVKYKGMKEAIQQKPELEYPGAREMKRRFILHIGPTNSGKTHDALERLKQCAHGAYFGPLRLLALEVYDRLNTEGLACSMITGEETLEIPGALCQACTVEMLNDHEYFDIAVVDECQMIADPYRGHNWTRAILGLRAEEIHLCMAPEAEDIVVQMIRRCGDQFKIIRHKRNTRLTLREEPYVLGRDLKKGDALIVFSKKSVLALAAHLENQGVHCSVIYGNLPPATRREQVRRFLAKETEVVVSTDAIGMGLNLPIRRIVFVETRKFDGVNKRTLNPEEIKQIAGRAGRYGLYDEGFVAAVDDVDVIADGLSRLPLPIMKAYVGFPEQLLSLPAQIDTLVKIWAGMDTPSIYVKMEVDELLALYQNFVDVHYDDMEEFPKPEIYKLITCAIDIDNKLVMDLWRDYCRDYREVGELEFPYSPGGDLYDLESYYKMLDLYFQFSRKVGLPVQAENLAKERHETEEEISRILKTECGSYTRKCSFCGKELSWDYPFSICERCFERGRSGRGRGHGGGRPGGSGSGGSSSRHSRSRRGNGYGQKRDNGGKTAKAKNAAAQ